MKDRNIYFAVAGFFVILTLFVCQLSKAGDFEFGTATLVGYKSNMADAATLAIPMRKAAIGQITHEKWSIITPPGWLWYSGDAGETWGDTNIYSNAGRPDFALIDHSSVAVLGDTLMVMSNRAASGQGMIVWLTDSTEIAWDTIPSLYNQPRGVLIGDTADDRYFWALWLNDGDYWYLNNSYFYTSDHDNWTYDFIDSIGDNARTGIFDWLGHPSFVTLSYDDESYYRYEWNGSAPVAHDDALIYTGSNADQERAFSCDGIITDDDSLFFLVNGITTFLVVHWKGYHGGTGAYNVDTIAEANYASIDAEDFQNTSMVINNKFCVYYINRTGADDMAHQFLYMRYFDPSDSSWSTEELVSQGLGDGGNVFWPNGVQKTAGDTSFIVWTHGVTSDSLVYLTVTDTSSGEAPAASTTKYIGGAKLGDVKL